MPPSVYVLGPRKAGKSTVATALAARLGLTTLHLDSVADRHRAALGFDEAAANEARSGGMEGWYRFNQPFDAGILERASAELDGCILEVAARGASFDDPALLERVRRALAPARCVVLLLPCADPDEARLVLEARQAPRVDGVRLDEHFVRHRSNHHLAKIVVYTDGRSPEQTRDEILARLDRSAAGIVLIGPMCAGKSTQGELLAERCGRPQVSLDRIVRDYYAELGWTAEEEQRIGAAEGFEGVYRYWKRFDLHALGRALEEHRDCVLDLGAGHSVYEDEAQLARARELLAPHPNVVLLLPSPDLDRSVASLRARPRETVGGLDMNRFYATRMAELATHTLYTEGKTPQQIAERIADLCQ